MAFPGHLLRSDTVITRTVIATARIVVLSTHVPEHAAARWCVDATWQLLLCSTVSITQYCRGWTGNERRVASVLRHPMGQRPSCLSRAHRRGISVT